MEVGDVPVGGVDDFSVARRPVREHVGVRGASEIKKGSLGLVSFFDERHDLAVRHGDEVVVEGDLFEGSAFAVVNVGAVPVGRDERPRFQSLVDLRESAREGRIVAEPAFEVEEG